MRMDLRTSLDVHSDPAVPLLKRHISKGQGVRARHSLLGHWDALWEGRTLPKLCEIAGQYNAPSIGWQALHSVRLISCLSWRGNLPRNFETPKNRLANDGWGLLIGCGGPILREHGLRRWSNQQAWKTRPNPRYLRTFILNPTRCGRRSWLQLQAEAIFFQFEMWGECSGAVVDRGCRTGSCVLNPGCRA